MNSRNHKSALDSDGLNDPLQALLTKAQQTKSAIPLFTRDELRSIVEQSVDGPVQTSSEMPHNTHLLSKAKIMTSLIGGLAISALVWLQLADQQAPSVQKASPTVTQPNPTASVVTAKGRDVATGSATRSSHASTDNTNQKQNIGQPSGSLSALSQTSHSTRSFIMASPQELAALGIVQDGDVFHCTIEEQYNEKESPAAAKAFIARLGYPLESFPLILRAKSSIKPNSSSTDALRYQESWEVSKPMGCSPYACVYYSGTEGSISTTMSTVDHSPYVQSQDITRELKREFSQLMRDLSSEIDLDFVASPSLPLQKRPYKYAQYLVPVAVNLSSETEIKMAVFYFIPTDNFLRKLSTTHQRMLASLEPVLRNSSLDIPYQGVSEAIDEEKIVTPSRIAGIEHLTLSADELEAIGVHFKNAQVQFAVDMLSTRSNQSQTGLSTKQQRVLRASMKHEEEERRVLHDKYGYNTDPSSVLVRRSVRMGLSCETDIDVLSYAGWNYNSHNPLSAVGYTATEFEMKVSQGPKVFDQQRCIDQQIIANSPLLSDSSKQFGTTSEQGELLNTGCTIPVRIILGTAADALPNSYLPKEGADSAHYHVRVIDIFFVPNREFVGHLPERYRSLLENELNLRDRIIKGELALSDACDLLHKSQSQSLLEMCTNPSSDIQALQVYPNPAPQESISCSFNARESGNYNISLYNTNGALEHNLLQTRFEQGYNSISMPLKGVMPGAYVLTLSSSSGIQARQRIIVH
jgi:hypothetical protein